MNTKSIDAIANAVLYEGYMLYPYRPSSVKNRQRFNFGVLYPQSYSEDRWRRTHGACRRSVWSKGLLSDGVEVKVRFLKLVDRSCASLRTPQPDERQASNSFFARSRREALRPGRKRSNVT